MNRILLPLLCLISACGAANHQDSLPGTYVYKTVGKMSIADDTLVITTSGENDNHYLVDYRSGFRTIRKGQLMPKVLKQRHYNMVFNQQTNMLEYGPSLITLKPVPDRKVIVFGVAEYHKIN